MRLVVCTGEGDVSLMQDSLTSLREPHVVTMSDLWFEIAAEVEKPRLFFKDKLKLMLFVLGKQAICIRIQDAQEESASMAASMYAMDVPVWPIPTKEES